MKKLLFVLIFSLLLTGCSSGFINLRTYIPENTKDSYSVIDKYREFMYVEDELKEVILEINNLKEKYKNIGLETGDDPLYIDVNNIDNIVVHFDSNMFNKKYYNDLIKILDKSIAKELKDYIKEIENQTLDYNEVTLKKIGKVAVYTESREEFEDNFISIRVDFSGLKDKHYRDLFNGIFEDKYTLDNIEIGDKLTMMDFVNPNSLFHLYYDDHLSIRYNIFLKDKDIKKVNILMQGKNGIDLEQDDIDVFVNLLNTLGLKEDERKLLLNEYQNIFQIKSSNKKISLDSYKILINNTKGYSYSGKGRKLVYFSIEKK